MIVELFPEDGVDDVRPLVTMVIEDRWMFGWEDDPPEGHRVIIDVKKAEDYTLLYAMAAKLHPRELEAHLKTLDKAELVKRLDYVEGLDFGSIVGSDPAMVKFQTHRTIVYEMVRRYVEGLP